MALVPHTQELQAEVDHVQKLRRTLHDAYIVESALNRRPSHTSQKPPSAMEVHRTVDAPTLAVLKSPNYPFSLCEEAPPSYVPPPVPFDVEGEIESLKQRVLQVQEAFQHYQKQQTKKGSRGGQPLSRAQILDFFGGNATFAEMAWEVSSLQWFYRWVLTHSISHLWNCKEQLEYVLTERDQELPQSVEEMDACLQELPFPEAVSVLDTDRQAVVAQERRRLRSVSRTFRDRVPTDAVTAATSCYLTPEEKYMYQEFFNQSEHMLLLLNHTLMLNQAKSGLVKDGRATPSQQNGAVGMLSNSVTSGRGPSHDSGAMTTVADSMIGEMDVSSLAEETLNAVSAEQEVITTLMKTIRERQAREECFDVSEAEYQHSRTAQIAVYGCVLSDMSLMGQQMALVAEFVERYQDWLKLRGFETHEELMSELSRRSGGTAWPSMDIYGDYSAEDGHDHFVPPTEEMMARYPRPADGAEKPREDAYANFDSAPSPTTAPAGQKEQAKPAAKPPAKAAAPRAAPKASPAAATTAAKPPASSAASERSQASKKPAPVSGAVASPAGAKTAAPPLHPSSEVANAYFAILKQAAAVCEGDAAVARVWLLAAVRYTVVKLLRREWAVADAAKNIAQAEEELLGLLHRHGALSRLTATAAALCLVAHEVARLCLAKCEMRSLTAEVAVAVHVPEDADDYATAVADVMTPVEEARWGSVVDAVWFQVDPSTQSSGGLLLAPTGADHSAVVPQRTNKNSVLHFLYIESIDAPPTPQNRGTASIHLRYRLPRMSPDSTASRRVAPTLASVAGAQPSSNGGLARYQLARRLLAALFEIEAKGLLPCFACRLPEVGTVPLTQMAYVTFDDANTSVAVDRTHLPLLCMLPPAAIELRRLHASVGVTPSPEDGQSDPHYAVYAAPAHFSTIGLLVSAALEEMAARPPVLTDLYMTASSLREQSLWEVKSGTPCKSFANATTHPIPVSCAPAKTRAISIQRESVANRNSAAPRRFVTPLLRHVDDKITALEFGASSSVVAQSNNSSLRPDGAVLTPRAPPPPVAASVTGRQTQMVGGMGTASPSPSAVRPNRR